MEIPKDVKTNALKRLDKPAVMATKRQKIEHQQSRGKKLNPYLKNKKKKHQKHLSNSNAQANNPKHQFK